MGASRDRMSFPDQGGRHGWRNGLLSRRAILTAVVLGLGITGAALPALAQGQAIIVPPPVIEPSPRAPEPAPAARPAGGIPAPCPARGLTWKDVPDDAGRAIDLSWQLSPDDTLHLPTVQGYYLMRSENPGGPWTLVDSVAAGISGYRDQSASLRRNVIYFYRIDAHGPGGATPQRSVTGPAIAVSQWFNHTRWNVLALTMLFFAFVLFFIQNAQREGKKPFLRRIPGIDAIEEAIGRATEMGRPVLYVPGIQDIDEMQTVQSLIILESVAKTTARYETPIKVPVTYPIPFTIAQEMVRGGYVHAGRPEQYDPDSVQFVSPEQFAYVAAVTGIMMRDRPAAHIFLGAFFAESLLLAETGFATGAIQVAGTANANQLPFFVVACDYTLIGEELFAASAYLSGEPKLVGSLKGADLMKLVILVVVLAGCLLETLGYHGLTQWLATK
jgi:hypothetical protein